MRVTVWCWARPAMSMGCAHLRSLFPGLAPNLLTLASCLLGLALSSLACEDEPSRQDDAASDTRDARSDAPTDSTATGDTPGGADSTAANDTAIVPDAGDDTATAPDVSQGGAAYKGAVLFFEPFEDTAFSERGWYDDSANIVLSAAAPHAGSSAFECRFLEGQRGCAGGSPGRHQFDAQEAVYLSFWVRYSDNYVGSQRSYHPHEFHFITDKDDRWIGPSATHLTTYVEQTGGVPKLALQDSLNVDDACILRNDDAFVGCNGDFDSYVFTEARSVASCNGLVGDVDGRDCFDNGGYWYSARAWRAPERMFGDTPGPRYKGDWHFVEVYFELNTIESGEGVPNGAIRYFFDGELIISSDRILMRTAVNADMRFNQFLVAPYIGDGSPVEQVMWVDDLTVAVGQRP